MSQPPITTHPRLHGVIRANRTQESVRSGQYFLGPYAFSEDAPATRDGSRPARLKWNLLGRADSSLGTENDGILYGFDRNRVHEMPRNPHVTAAPCTITGFAVARRPRRTRRGKCRPHMSRASPGEMEL